MKTLQTTDWSDRIITTVSSYELSKVFMLKKPSYCWRSVGEEEEEASCFFQVIVMQRSEPSPQFSMTSLYLAVDSSFSQF